MEKQVFLLGDKHNGNDIKETNCPCCNSDQLVHGLPEVFDGRFVRDPWECMICGSSGIAESTTQFSQHIVEVDKTKKTLKDIQYFYATITYNDPKFEKERVLDTSPSGNNYCARKKYALIVRAGYSDDTETIYRIKYSNNLFKLKRNVTKYCPTWYNYPLTTEKAMADYFLDL